MLLDRAVVFLADLTVVFLLFPFRAVVAVFLLPFRAVVVVFFFPFVVFTAGI
jgi:hypothetical protein